MTAFVDGQPVTLTGTVSAIEQHVTSAGRRDWATAQFTVGGDRFVLRIFPAVWPDARPCLADGGQVTVRGRIGLHTGERRLDAHHITSAAIGATS